MKATLLLLKDTASEDPELRTDDDMVQREILFSLRDIQCAFRDVSGNIIVTLDGEEMSFKYDKELWNKLELLFS